MRITFVLDNFRGGGKERRCLQLIQGLNKNGYKDIQVIIINKDIAYNELYEAEIELCIIDRKNRSLSPLSTYREISSLVKQFNPDILQVWGIFGAIFTNVLKLTSSFKYIGAYVADCNTPKLFSIFWLSVIMNKMLANKIIGNSQAGLDAYSVPKRKAELIYNGFNPDRLNDIPSNTEELKQQLGLNTKFVVPMIASFHIHKDYKTFIQAADIVTRKRDDVTFLCVGDGTDSDECKQLVDVKDNDRIRFFGFRTDVENILAVSNLSILCSNPLEHKEGLSNAILESLVMNVMVIATNDGGTPEIIEPGVNGFLIPPFAPEVLAQKIDEVLSNFEHYSTVSQGLRERVLEKFSLQDMIVEYERVYKSLISVN